MSSMDKISKSLKLDKDVIVQIIVQHYLLLHIYTDEELRPLDIRLDTKTSKRIEKIAKTLNVDFDAVVVALLYKHLEANREKTI